MGRGYLSPQLNDDLHQLTSAQMLGKIFIGSVYNPASAKLNTRGRASGAEQIKEVPPRLLSLASSPLMPRPRDRTHSPPLLLRLRKGHCRNQLFLDQY